MTDQTPVKSGIIILVCFSLLLLFSDPLSAEQPVSICIGSGSEWPPYTYYYRSNGNMDKTRLAGAAFDLMDQAFKMMGMTYSVKFFSWKRVQEEVANFGTNGLCEMSWDASYRDERAEIFYYTAPIYRTHLGAFYSKKRFPKGVQLQSSDDLVNHSVCGVLGYNYDQFDLKSPIDTGAKTVQIALDKLVMGRCDFFLSSIEPVYGGVIIGAYHIPADVVSFRFPNHYKTFYAIVSKTTRRADHLLTQLNQSIVILQGSGKAEQIFKAYLPDGSGL